MIVMLFATICSAQLLTDDDWIYESLEIICQNENDDILGSINTENRYQVSIAIADIIQKLDLENQSQIQRFGMSRKISLEDMIYNYNLTVPPEQELSEEYIAALFKLAHEYYQELSVLGYNIQDVATISVGKSNLEFIPDFAVSLNIGESSVPPQSQYDEPGFEQESVNDSNVVQPLTDDNNKLRYDFFLEENHQELDNAIFGIISDRSKDSSTELVVENMFPIWPNLYLGASLMLSEHDDQEDNDQNNRTTDGYAGLIGEYILGSDVVLEGQYLHNLSYPLQTGSLQLGARVRLGNIELGGLIQTPESNEDSTRTSIDLTYGIPDSISVRAGYHVDSDLKTIVELGNPASTSLDMNIPLGQGRIDLGLTRGWGQDDETDSEDDGETTSALVSFSYELSNETSFKLDYNLVNFSDVKTTAEISIRF